MAARRIVRSAFLAAAVAAAFGLAPSPPLLARQAKDPPPKSDPPKPDPPKPPKDQQDELFTIHILVTAGDKNKPVDSASVYVRYEENRKFRRDKLAEMDLKTSAEGKVRVPYVPKGKILIQVIAKGWKTYGKWFDLTEDGQVFKIHLLPPPHWY